MTIKTIKPARHALAWTIAAYRADLWLSMWMPTGKRVQR